MPTEREQADKMVLWLAKHTGPVYIVALYDGWEADLISGNADRSQIANRLRVLADRLERP
jgi:hypothetical protein